MIGRFLYQRYPDLVQGHAAPADVFVFFVLVALCLAPIFQEMNFFGLKFQQEIKDLKAHVDAQLNVLKSDIRNSVNFQPQINIPLSSPPPDNQLPAIREIVESAINETMEKYGVRLSSPHLPTIDGNVSLLFASRYNIEKELFRIAALDPQQRRRTPIFRLVQDLVDDGILDPRLGNAIRELIRVCSPVIHGEDTTAAQVEFVRDTASKLVSALQAVGTGSQRLEQPR
jgi:hypothetical protein